MMQIPSLPLANVQSPENKMDENIPDQAIALGRSCSEPIDHGAPVKAGDFSKTEHRTHKNFTQITQGEEIPWTTYTFSWQRSPSLSSFIWPIRCFPATSDRCCTSWY